MLLIGGCASTIGLIHPKSGARVVCSNRSSAEQLRQLPTPSDFGAFGSVQALYDTGRINWLEYCARRYELAGYVRSTTLATGHTITYLNRDYGWSVTYPDSLRLDDSDRGWVKLSRGSAVVGIHTFPRSSGKTLDEIADIGLRSWAEHIGIRFVEVSRRHVALADRLPAIEVVHEMGTGQIGRSRKIIAIDGDRILWVDAETFLDSWSTFV
jgi:hypothetical protein